jgi:uncharacterized surface protein with fasciclin (FAS1) repeats
MKKSLITLMTSAALAITFFAATTHAQMSDPTVGGAAMFPTKNIVENAADSPIHKTLVAAVKAAGLVDTLEGPGPFTVFAPTDDAFAKLPAGTVDNLLKPENHDTLVKILTYHVVPGKITTKDLKDWIKKGNGTYSAKTVQGGMLIFTDHMGHIMITDEKGGKAEITTANVIQSNGVIQVINAVLMPN